MAAVLAVSSNHRLMPHRRHMPSPSKLGNSIFWSNRSFLSCVYRPTGANFGGFGSSAGSPARESPLISLMILNLSGSSPRIGLVLSATGLYFLVVLSSIFARALN